MRYDDDGITEQLAGFGFIREELGGGLIGYTRRAADGFEEVITAIPPVGEWRLNTPVSVGDYPGDTDPHFTNGYTLNDVMIALSDIDSEYTLLSLRLLNAGH
jgi:hypothetical protein